MIVTMQQKYMVKFQFEEVFNVLNDVPYSQLTLCAKWTYNVHNDRT